MKAWGDLSADDRHRFLDILQGILEGARAGYAAQSSMKDGAAFDAFVVRAATAAIEQLRKAGGS